MSGKILSIPICEVPNDKRSVIRVSKSRRENENVIYADIRKFDLIPINGQYDGKLKATKGIHFSIDKIPDIINALKIIYESETGNKL